MKGAVIVLSFIYPGGGGGGGEKKFVFGGGAEIRRGQLALGLPVSRPEVETTRSASISVDFM